MQLTPEQIQGILELEPRAQVDRLQGNKPYIHIGYWGQIRDLDKFQVGLAKLGLKATEIDDYDEDTGWGYWYELEPIQGAINEEMSPGDYIKFLMDKFYEYRMLAADSNNDDRATKLYSDKAMEYYERAQEEMDKIAPDMTDHLSDEDKALPNVPMNENKNKMEEINLKRWSKLAGINEALDAQSLIGQYIDISQNVGMSGRMPRTAQDVIDIMPHFKNPNLGIAVLGTEDPGTVRWGHGIYLIQPDGTLKGIRSDYDTSG